MERDLRLAILGTGHMAQTFAGAMETVRGVTLAGFCSRDLERARTYGTYFGAPGSYAALDDILADPAVDALYVANDTAAHAAVAISALEAGKAVLCEKPCGIDASQASAIAETAQRTGTLFMEAIPTPFLPAVKAVLDAARSGHLGQSRRFTADFGYPATPQSHPACFAPQGGGVLLDRAIYPIALALLAMGPALDVQATVNRNADGIDVEAWITLTHEGGATSSLGASFLSELQNQLSIAGTSGTASVEAPLLAAERFAVATFGRIDRAPPVRPGLVARLKRKPLLRRATAVARTARTAHHSYGESLYGPEIAHFRDLLRAGAIASPVLPPSLSVAAMTVIDAARSAAP